MAYFYYNANPLKNNIADCTIRAISVATGKSWDYVYNNLSEEAQKRGLMIDDKRFIIDYLDSKYNRIFFNNRTVGELSRMYDDNVILITMIGHIVCSRYGIVIDTQDCRKRQAEFAWVVE